MAFRAEPSPNLKAQVDVKNRVNDSPRGNYMLAHHPSDWVIDVNGHLMPSVSHLSKDVGAGAVAANGDFRQAAHEYQDRGFVLIPHDVLGDEDYVAMYRNKKGKKVHRSIFQRGYNTVAGTTEWAHDGEAWYAFIDFLRERNYIKQPTVDVVQGMLEVQRNVLANVRAPRTDDQAMMERYERRISNVKRAISTLEDELVKSERTYGVAASPGRAAVLQALMKAREENVKDSSGENLGAAILDRLKENSDILPSDEKVATPNARPKKPPK